MSLFQCESCGCCENTALSSQGFKPTARLFDWGGKEHLKGKRVCSACGPAKYSDGSESGYGKWHGRFDRVFLPMGKFKTNKEGNLEHVERGDTNYKRYAVAVCVSRPKGVPKESGIELI